MAEKDGKKNVDTGDLSNSTKGDKLQKIFVSGEFSDIVLEVEGSENVQAFSAHKLILAMASEHFETWFFETLPAKIKMVTIKNVNPKHFHVLLRFIYTNYFEAESTLDAIQVAYVAERFAVHELFVLCLCYIEENLASSNIWESYKLALNFELESLVRKVTAYIVEHQVVLTFPEFYSCSEDVVESLVTNIASHLRQGTLFTALTLWAKKQLGLDLFRKMSKDDAVAVRFLVIPYFSYIDFLSMTPDIFAVTADETNMFTDEEFTSIAFNIIGSKNWPLPHWCNKKRHEKTCSREKFVSLPVWADCLN